MNDCRASVVWVLLSFSAAKLRVGSLATRLAARFLVVALCALVPAFVVAGCGGKAGTQPTRPAVPVRADKSAKWSLASPAFRNNGRIPPKYTCDGANVSPALSWPAPPKGTVELALTCDDPDAPGGNFVHWVLYGLPPSRQSLPEGIPASEMLPKLGGARHGRTDFGRIGYGGPCPPKGPSHHYHFRLYALGASTNLAPGAAEAELARAMRGHILSQAELVGLYSR
jgi:hypothetical protein